METHRKAWNKRQTELRNALTKSEDFEEAIRFFLSQHAALHAMQMADTEPWSFEDWVFESLTEKDIRSIPDGESHSIAWLIWHLARIEDVAMNYLVAGDTQRFFLDSWHEKLNVQSDDTGNLMPDKIIRNLSEEIDIESLRTYRLAVGRQTRQIVQKLQAADHKRKPDPRQLQKILDDGAVVPEAQDLIDYWSKRTIAGLLLMPPTRHCFVHLNEALRIKRKLT